MTDSTGNVTKVAGKALADPVVAAALDALVQHGCDRDALVSLFERLRRAEKVRIRSRKALKRLSRTLSEASAGVAGLTAWSESHRLGLPGDHETWLRDCSHDLELLAHKILSRMEVNAKDADPQLDYGRAEIVEHVVQRTGATHDEKLALIVAAVLGWKDYGFDQHVSWRMGRIPTS